MLLQQHTSIIETDQELQNPETSEERVHELFVEWWDRKTGCARQENEDYVLPVKCVDSTTSPDISPYGELHFPKNKLTQEHLELLEKNDTIEDKNEQADEFILWAAGRAAAIAIIPLPLADVGPLMANEAYMIYRLADVYGYTIDKSVVTMLAGIAGGSILGKIGASLLPFLKIPIAAGVTYAVGKAAKAYFASGMTLSKENLTDIFTNARKEADDINWKNRQ